MSNNVIGLQPCKRCNFVFDRKIKNRCVKCQLVRHRKNELRKLYNLTVEQYDKMVEDQNGLCAICGKNPAIINAYHDNNRHKKLVVDHNHKTGKIRGLLCNNCNRILGLVKEDPYVLHTMCIYLAVDKGLIHD